VIWGHLLVHSFEPSARQIIGGKSLSISQHIGSSTNAFNACDILPNSCFLTHDPAVEFDPGCEAMIFSTDGTPLQGITGEYGGDRRVEYIIPLDARKKNYHEFVIESSCNGMFGVPSSDLIEAPDVRSYFSNQVSSLIQRRRTAILLLLPQTSWFRTRRPGVFSGTSKPSAS
jgi:hypothetical protein